MNRWSSGEVVVYSVFGTLALVLLALPGITLRLADAAPVLAWVIAIAFGIYIAAMQAEMVQRHPLTIEAQVKSALGRMPGFIAGWLWWWFCTIAVVLIIITAGTYMGGTSLLIKLWGGLFVLFIGYYIYHRSPMLHDVIYWVNIVWLACLGLLIASSLQTFSFVRLAQDVELYGLWIALFLSLMVAASSFLAGFFAVRSDDPKGAITPIIAAVAVGIVMFVSVFAFGSSHPIAIAGESTYLLQIALPMLGSPVIPLTIITIVAILAALLWFSVAAQTAHHLAEDSLLFRRLAQIHPKYKTTAPAFEFQAVVILVLLAVTPAGKYVLFDLFATQAFLFALICQLVLVSYVVQKSQDHRFKREHSASIWIAALVAVLIGYLEWVYLITASNGITSARVAASIFVLGIPVYLLMELYYNNRAVRKTSDMVAYLALFLENLTLPKKIRSIAMENLGALSGKRVLELGCSVGTLTIDIAKAVGSNGKVYATDISEKDLLIARRRMIRKGFYNVRMIHDPSHTKRVHPKIPKVDAIVSVGMLGYFSDPLEVLKTLNHKIPRDAPIVFIDYDKFFDVIPNQDWLRHASAIVRTFRKAGFSVEVARRQGFAWRYVIITGKKSRSV